LFLVVSCFYKPLRNCHRIQQVSKVQCKKPAKKTFLLKFYLGIFRDFWLIFQEILQFFHRFNVDFLLDLMFF